MTASLTQQTMAHKMIILIQMPQQIQPTQKQQETITTLEKILPQKRKKILRKTAQKRRLNRLKQPSESQMPKAKRKNNIKSQNILNLLSEKR